MQVREISLATVQWRDESEAVAPPFAFLLYAAVHRTLVLGWAASALFDFLQNLFFYGYGNYVSQSAKTSSVETTDPDTQTDCGINKHCPYTPIYMTVLHHNVDRSRLCMLLINFA